MLFKAALIIFPAGSESSRIGDYFGASSTYPIELGVSFTKWARFPLLVAGDFGTRGLRG
jgi:hypothetical protein